MCCRLWLKLFNKRPGYLFVRAVTMLKQQNYPGMSASMYGVVYSPKKCERIRM